MNLVLTHLRERCPKHWCMRLLLGIAMLGLMLGSASFNQIHMHADADPGHSHEHSLDGQQGSGAKLPDDPASGSLHVHDVTSSPLIFGSISSFDGLSDFPSEWGAGEDFSPPPLSPQSTPHRPPIA